MSATCRHSGYFYYIRFPFHLSLLSFFFLQEYKWDNIIKGNLLASFFWGYVITQIPAGPLAQRFGPKILLTLSVFICSLFTILMPVAAEVGGWGLLCGTRVIQGLAQVSH
jgi:MFS family permease